MQDTTNNTLSIILGALTSIGVGTLFFQAIGTLVLGLIGALGGYLFQRFLKPRLDSLFNKKNEPEA